MPFVPTGGLTGDLNDYLGIGAAVTGLIVGMTRYGMVLLGASKVRVERVTAIGFYLGIGAAAVVLAYLVAFT